MKTSITCTFAFKIKPLAGIYIHIPFCRQACHYCNFHFSTSTRLVEQVVDAIIAEITRRQDYLDEKITTIYFGGGTPSLLEIKHLDKLLNQVYESFVIKEGAEITIEANPEDITLVRSKRLQKSGFNRVSVGIQTFDDKILKFLNRNHDSQMSVAAVLTLRQAGFANINVDLIYGIPGQPVSQWHKNLDQVIALRPNHISSYALTIEPNTAFGNWQQKGKIKPMGDDEIACQFEVMTERLINAGYVHYEVSNFALPEFESKHNSAYWQQIPYVGVGPGAHSYNRLSRQFNISNNPEYVRRIKNGNPLFEIEILSEKEKLNEYLFMGLRTHYGINLALVKKEFRHDILDQHGELINHLIKTRKATLLKDVLTLTSAGFLIADSIVVEFMPD
jgi:oxygen-independent coproporphyrinogen-3 oxidase